MTEDEKPKFKFPDPRTDHLVTPERLRRTQEWLDRQASTLPRQPYPSREATDVHDASFLEAIECMNNAEWRVRYWPVIKDDEEGGDRAE